MSRDRRARRAPAELLALVAVASSIGLQFGYALDAQVTEVLIAAVIAVVIAGIAHEDAAAKAAAVTIADVPSSPPATPAESEK